MTGSGRFDPTVVEAQRVADMTQHRAGLLAGLLESLTVMCGHADGSDAALDALADALVAVDRLGRSFNSDLRRAVTALGLSASEPDQGTAQ